MLRSGFLKKTILNKRKSCMIGILTLIFFISSCASIFSGKAQSVNVDTDPDEAKIRVYNNVDMKVYSGETPCNILLERGNGYFRPATYRVEIERDGYESIEFDIKGSLNGWYIGNILIGGLIGFLIVDPLTGAMWSLSPNQIDRELQKKVAYRNNGLIIELTKNSNMHLIDDAILVKTSSTQNTPIKPFMLLR